LPESSPTDGLQRVAVSPSLLVEPTGKLSVVANADHPTPYAYFVSGATPEICVPDTPLTYRNLRVYRVQPGASFDLGAWRGKGGTSYTLSVEAGAISSTQPGGASTESRARLPRVGADAMIQRMQLTPDVVEHLGVAGRKRLFALPLQSSHPLFELRLVNA
jgi:hypothetical protein